MPPTPSSSSRTTSSPARRPTRSTSCGQKWGNPLYDWDALAREGYRWWTERLRRMLGLFDVFRIDHFRGFAGLLGRAGGRDGARGPLGAAAPEPPSSAPPSASSASCR